MDIKSCDEFPENFTENFDFNTFNDIDFTKISFGLKPTPKPAWEIAVKCIVFAVIVIIGLLGNYLIIHVIVKFKESRTCTNLFICNMAIADFFSVVFCAWAALANDLSHNYVLGAFYCKFESFTKVTCILSSALSLSVISCYRLVIIWNSSSSGLNSTFHNRTYVIIFIVWFVAVIVSIPLAVRRQQMTREWCDFTEVWCSEDEVLRPYWLCLLAFMVYIPLSVMTIVYAVIILKLKTLEEKLGKTTNSSLLEHRRKIIKMLFIYLINAAICWLPLQIVVFYRYQRNFDQTPKMLRVGVFVAHLFISINSAINPIIYGVANKSFRALIVKLHPKLVLVFGNVPVSTSNRATPVLRTPLCLNALYVNRSNLTSSQQRRSNQHNLNTISLKLSRRRSGY